MFRQRGYLEPPLPPMVEALVTEEGRPRHDEDDCNKYAILISSGLAWEINGVLQKKGSFKSRPESKAPRAPTAPVVPLKEASLESQKAPASSVPRVAVSHDPAHDKPAAAKEQDAETSQTCSVRLENFVSRLPAGKNLVTMTKNGHAMMQIKLPITSTNQHWATIRVDEREGSVQESIFMKLRLGRKGFGQIHIIKDKISFKTIDQC
jgi:hypothetical protein